MYVATRRAVRARVYRPVATAVASRLRFLSSSSGDILNIGGVRKQLSEPRHPELIPALVDVNVGQGVLRVLKWMLQKDVLGQDMFLIGPPGPFRRHVCMKFLQLTRREVEYVALSRDTTESDLKQRREISSGTAHYVDQAAVRAALHGRVLVLEGIEKAERNVLPVLNNLMENREMQLEDGRFLLNADRYDALVQEHSEAELRRWRLARVSRQFRVVALGLPVPPYSGNPLDPPLRSRFQAYDLQSATVPYQEQLEQLQHVAPQLSRQTLSDLLSFGLTVNCREEQQQQQQQQQQQLKLPDFPLDLLPALAKSLNNVPEAEVGERVHCIYPSSIVLPADLQPSVSLVRRQFDLADPSDQPPRPMRVCHVTRQPSTCDTSSFAQVTLGVDAAERTFQVPCGNGAVSDTHSDDNNFVLTTYHERLLAQLVMSHATHDLCVVGPRGCGKSAIVRYMAAMLGYDIEPVVLYQDMTSRDLLQQRDTCSDSGDTLWRSCALVEAAVHGKLAVLDGIHRVHAGTLNVLHRLVHDRELQLYDGSRLLRHDHYDQLAANAGALSQHDMQARGLYRVHPSFRIVALAEPPTHGGSKGAWLTPELMSLFFYHHMRAITMQEEAELLVKRSGGVELDTRARDVLQVSHALRSSSDANLQSLAHCLSMRQLLRVCRRMAAFPGETAYHAIHKACLTRFLPPLTRQALDGVVHSAGILPDITTSSSLSHVGSRVCHVHDGVLTIGTTSVPVSSASRRDHVSGHASAKVPRTLFYDIDQHVDVLEAILEDFSLGENILLVGNQGVGKNKLVDRFLQLIDRPREYIQLHRDTTVQTLTQQSTVRDGRIVHEDSALLRAVRLGHVLVVDEADKAATHTTCVLKTLVEDGEMVLSDGRRLRRHITCDNSNVVPIHPSFQLIVLANRPGFPFLGNDFFAALGDLFSCHAIDNPSRESERVLLKQYGPDVPDESIDKLVNMFAELREMADQGGIAYPYSTREAVNIVKHLQCYGDDGLASAVGNVFDFDSYSGETRTTLLRVLHKHGVPVGASLDDVHLATQHPLPDGELWGSWRVSSDRDDDDGGDDTAVVRPSSSSIIQLPLVRRQLNYRGPYKYSSRAMAVQRVHPRGAQFNEMSARWRLPLDDSELLTDLLVTKADLRTSDIVTDMGLGSASEDVRLLASCVCPAGVYNMPVHRDYVDYIPLYYHIQADNAASHVEMAPLSHQLSGKLVCHEQQGNCLVLLDIGSNVMWRIMTSGVLSSAGNMLRKSLTSASGQDQLKRWRMVQSCSDHNVLALYEDAGKQVQLLDLNSDSVYSFTSPMVVHSLHPLPALSHTPPSSSSHCLHGACRWLLQSAPDSDHSTQRFVVHVSDDWGSVDITAVREQQTHKRTSSLTTVTATADSFCSYQPSVLKHSDNVSGPSSDVNTLLMAMRGYHVAAAVKMSSADRHVQLVRWPRARPARRAVFQQDKCTLLTPQDGQVVHSLKPDQLPSEMRHLLPHQSPSSHPDQHPGMSDLSGYLEVTDLPLGCVRYLPVFTERRTRHRHSTRVARAPLVASLPDHGVVSVDQTGSVCVWETSLSALNRSLLEWRRSLQHGGPDVQITYERDNVGEVDGPKHGKQDENNAPHVGGNTWAGGTGGRDTAGLGGIGGPYRLDAGHHVHQVAEHLKENVPEHVRKAAREMNRRAFAERLRQIEMSAHDAALYHSISGNVRKQVQSLRVILSALQAKDKERLWMKNQTTGELDDAKLIEGLTGERAIYKRRGEQDPELGAEQNQPKILQLVTDVSGSMYRFNGYDGRLDRTLEAVTMVMEAFDGFEQKFRYNIVGHSGEDYCVPFVDSQSPPANEKQRLQVLKTMQAHAQFCISGDSTVQATRHAIDTVAQLKCDEAFVIVLSDANLERYGISAAQYGRVLSQSPQIGTSVVFLGSLGDQADRLCAKLPSGKAFVCLQLTQLPHILQQIFTSSLLH